MNIHIFRFLLLSSTVIYSANLTLAQEHYSMDHQVGLLKKADSLNNTGNYQSAIPYFDKLLTLDTNDSLSAPAYYGKGYALFSLNEISSAIDQIQESVKTYSKYLQPNHSKLIRPYAMLGYLYRYFQTNERLALKYYQLELKAILANDTSIGIQSKFYNAYNLATTYRLIEDYELALNYGFRALQIAQNDQNNQFLELSYSVIANTYSASKQNKEAIAYYLRKIQTTSTLRGKQSTVLVKDFDNLALAQSGMGNFSEALDSFNKSLNISVAKKLRQDHAYTLMLIGTLFNKKGDTQKAKEYLFRSLSGSTNRKTKTLIFESIANALAKEHRFDSAQYYFQKSVAISLKIDRNSILDTPLEELQAVPIIFQTLKRSAQTYLNQYKSDSNIIPLQKAHLIYQRIDSVASSRRNLLSTQESKLFFQKNAYQLYESALETTYQLNENDNCDDCLEAAWHYMETNRNLTLQELMDQASFYEDIGWSNDIKLREKELKEDATRLKSQIVSCELDNDCTEQELTSLRNKSLQNEQQYSRLLDSLQGSSSTYYNRKYLSSAISLENYQKSIKDELLISFFQGEQHIYWLAVDKQTKEFGRIKFDKPLKTDLSNFLSEISGQTLSQNGVRDAFTNYHQSAYRLYRTLLAPILENTNNKKLVMLANGVLHELPFEALIMEPVAEPNRIDFKNLKYLITTYQIDYGLSANLLHQSKLTQVIEEPKTLAFGNPIGETYAKLQGSVKELEAIQKITSNPKVFNGKSATKAAFKSATDQQDFDILHLALHGSANRQNSLNSKLFFSSDLDLLRDSVLHLYELFTLNLSAKLVVLSACETNLGQWSKGEGTISLARGFAYNNNPNIVTSLWKINDLKSAQLVSDFYKHLYAEKSISESLREAKLQLLSTSNELTAHPSNWAALVHFGNSELVISSKRNLLKSMNPILILITLFFFTIVLIALYKKRLS